MSNKDNKRSSLMDYQQQHHSFSSSLLEEIYRSFDNDDDSHGNYNISYRKSSSSSSSSRIINKSNSCYMERENKFQRQDMFHANNKNHRHHEYDDDYNNNVKFRRNSLAEVNSNGKLKLSSSSSTSSSDSSSGIGGFSSSENESLYSSKSKSKSKLKPIRTSFDPPEFHRKSYSDEIPAKKKSAYGGSKEGNLQKRALKLYGDLKKVKQPISPGGKLATFLNSLFNSTTPKKPKISSSSSVMTSSTYGEKFSSMSTPSTASSYARSCLSKTPSSAGRFERRSVRFCPVNTVISTTTDNINECNVRKESYNDNNEELKVKIMEKQRRVEEVAKELLKNYHHGRKYNQNDVVNMINKSNSNSNSNIRSFEVEDEDEEEEEEDDVSCCSSDLFELENLLDIGVDRRYREELPVYETTHVHTNRAIANGFIL